MKLKLGSKLFCAAVSFSSLLLVLAVPRAGAQGFALSTQYTFTGKPDGAGPTSTLISDSSGNLYGTTTLGGASNNGTVFELVCSSGTAPCSGTYSEKVLYSFTGKPDGANPYAGLIMDTAGDLYGTTPAGGANNYGTAFELVCSNGTSPCSGTYSVKEVFF